LPVIATFSILQTGVIAPDFGRGGSGEDADMTAVISAIESTIQNENEQINCLIENDMATKSERIEFVKAVYPAAKALWEKQDSIHPVFVTAQAALETGWRIRGASNNIFGITKGSSWTGPTALELTTEYFPVPDKRFRFPEEVESVTEVSPGRWKYRAYRLFRVYGSLEECLSDHLAVLRKSGYADAYPYRNDPKEFARRISDSVGAGYATAPDYAETMAIVIDMVTRIIREQGL
jgi:flagellar protein FlgJ